MFSSQDLWRRIVSLLLVAVLGGEALKMTMEEYFPEMGDDLSTVTWAHAVNSKKKLHDAIQEHVMMLEADVVLGSVVGGSGPQIPVMGHPPANTSDLSLKAFLTEVIAVTQKGQRCGIKLDFKSLEVLEPSLDELKLHIKQINFPVMLNADILPGPLNSTTKPVHADTFLTLCGKLFPESTLSVGWTTRYGGLIFDTSYTDKQVLEMEEALNRNHITQPVTFPIRAGIAAKSAKTLVRLKDNIANSTFTVWSSESDPVDVDLLRELIVKVLGKDRVFVDVPKKLMDQLFPPRFEPLSETRSSATVLATSSVKTAVVSLATMLMYFSK